MLLGTDEMGAALQPKQHDQSAGLDPICGLKLAVLPHVPLGEPQYGFTVYIQYTVYSTLEAADSIVGSW